MDDVLLRACEEIPKAADITKDPVSYQYIHAANRQYMSCANLICPWAILTLIPAAHRRGSVSNKASNKPNDLRYISVSVVTLVLSASHMDQISKRALSNERIVGREG